MSTSHDYRPAPHRPSLTFWDGVANVLLLEFVAAVIVWGVFWVWVP